MIPTQILALLVVAFGTLAGGFFLTGTASADTPDHRTSLIEQIASQFNLNKDDVQHVFDEERAARQEEATARLEARLSQAVANGTITEDQKAAILAKHEEWQKERAAHAEARRTMTPEERREDAEKRRDEMRTWAKEHSIPEGLIGIRAGMFGHGNGYGRFEK